MFHAIYHIAGSILWPPLLEMAKTWPFYGQYMVHTWSGPLWPKHGPHLVLEIGSSWILINVPGDVPCQISHCWVYPVVPFLKNGQNMALLWQKHGPHMVFQIGSSWILINVPRDVLSQISHCWVYPVAPFPGNVKNMDFFGQYRPLRICLISNILCLNLIQINSQN